MARMPRKNPNETRIEDSGVYEKVMSKVGEGAPPVKTLRGFFGIALGREQPVSQATLAGWCDVTAETIAAIEKGRLKLSNKFAGYLYRISGASHEWLLGEAEVEEFGYSSLQRWFPGSFPSTVGEWEAIRVARRSGNSAKEFFEKVFLPVLTQPKVPAKLGRELRLPTAVIDELRGKLGCAGTKPIDRDSLWWCYAFSDSPDDLSLPTELQLLDPVVRLAERDGHKIDRSSLPELLHYAIYLRGKMERANVDLVVSSYAGGKNLDGDLAAATGVKDKTLDDVIEF